MYQHRFRLPHQGEPSLTLLPAPRVEEYDLEIAWPDGLSLTLRGDINAMHRLATDLHAMLADFLLPQTRSEVA